MTKKELIESIEKSTSIEDKRDILNKAILKQLNTFLTATTDVIESKEFIELDETIKNLFIELK
jgi:nucleoid DNA-binding protein